MAPGENVRDDVGLGETKRIELQPLEAYEVQQIFDRNFPKNTFRDPDEGAIPNELALTLDNRGASWRNRILRWPLLFCTQRWSFESSTARSSSTHTDYLHFHRTKRKTNPISGYRGVD